MSRRPSCQRSGVAAPSGHTGGLLPYLQLERLSGACQRNSFGVRPESFGRPAMAMNQSDIDRLQRAVATSLHEHWLLFLIEGIIFLILGVAAVVVPPLATLAV